MALARDNVTPVHMCESDFIMTQPSKQANSPNPEGRPGEDGSIRVRWEH